MNLSIATQAISLVIATALTAILAYLVLNIGKSKKKMDEMNEQGGNALSRRALQDQDYVDQRLKGFF